MDFLFSRKQRLLYEMLTILYSENRFWTLDELAVKIPLSRPTIQSNLQLISQLLEPLQEDARLIRSFKGSYLYKKPSIGFNRIRLLLLTESIPFKFIDSITFKKHPSLSAFCEDNYISKSHFYKIIQECKTFLSDYEIIFHYANMEFKGKETNIRYFLYSFLWECYGGIKWPFSTHKDNRHFAKQRDLLSEELNFSFSYLEQLRHSFLVNITKLRFEQGYTIGSETPSNIIIFPELAKIVQDAISDTFSSSSIVRNETQYLYKMICINIWKSLKPDHVKKIIQSYRKDNPEETAFSNRVLELFKTEFGMDLSDNDQAVYSLLSIGDHARYMGSISREIYMARKIAYYKDCFPFYSNILDRFLTTLSLDSNYNSFTTAKDFLFLQLTYILECHKSLATFDPQIRIWVTHSSYSNKVTRIEKLVKKYSPFHVKVFTGHYPPKNYDLILSDVELPEFSDQNVFVYTDPPILGEIKRIENAVREINNQNLKKLKPNS
ncbi:hypothetical protein HB852_14045 [Listeria grandensis]|uniref:helix-turn-helix domain-containing protein n=1 Tax=Listeria grandensis TaxID=1494963 RepID=UPI00162A7015|nr:helix-turn-helix domain-containing protein [Listeria grandensis]MBC1475733.1 hypothetical protein [Listeria grandensis]